MLVVEEGGLLLGPTTDRDIGVDVELRQRLRLRHARYPSLLKKLSFPSG
jgi:hypothetical protein